VDGVLYSTVLATAESQTARGSATTPGYSTLVGETKAIARGITNVIHVHLATQFFFFHQRVGTKLTDLGDDTSGCQGISATVCQ